MKKRLSLVIQTIAILIGIVIGGYYFYGYYSSKKILDEAKAYKGIGDYKNAIESYKKYLLKKPDATSTKLDLALVLLKEKQEEQAIKILNIVRTEARSKNIEDLQKRAKEDLEITYGKLAVRLREEAEKALEKKDYSLAREKYEEELFYLEAKIMLETSFEEGFKVQNKNVEECSYFDLFSVCNPLVENLANIALTYWLEGKYEEADEAISERSSITMLLDRMDFGEKRYNIFASKLDELGGMVFDKNKYKTARKHWEGALKNYKKGDQEMAKENIPIVQYNIALTYYTQEYYQRAKTLFAQLQKDFPEYKSSEVKELIKFANTYWNEKNSSLPDIGGKYLLELERELKRKHPTYQKKDVQENIDKID